MFRVTALAVLVLAAPALLPAHAQQSQPRPVCPANASAAGYDIGPVGSLRTGQAVEGTHPCGRRITCTGGDRVQGTRACRWL